MAFIVVSEHTCRLVKIRDNHQPPLQDCCHEKENGAHAKHDSDWECIYLQNDICKKYIIETRHCMSNFSATFIYPHVPFEQVYDFLELLQVE